jgi:hypothetical protein
MPDEVHPLAQRVAVVHPVVSEHPHLRRVEGRQHRQTCDEPVEPSRIEQRSVGGVVAEDEQTRHRHTGEHPQRHEEVPPVGRQQRDDREAVDGEVTSEQPEAADGRPFVAPLGDHVDDGLQRGRARDTSRIEESHRDTLTEQPGRRYGPRSVTRR